MQTSLWWSEVRSSSVTKYARWLNSKQMNKRLWKYIFTHELVSGETVKCDETLQKVGLVVLCQLAHPQIRNQKERSLHILCRSSALLPSLQSIIKEHSTPGQPLPSKQKSRQTAAGLRGERARLVGTVVTTRKAFRASPELQAVIGCSHCTRSDCLKKIWQYIREHKLQNAERKCIVNDAAMKAVFGTDEMKSVDIMVRLGESGE